MTLGACGALFAKGPHVPSAYQGTTEITVANAFDRELCVFMMFQNGGATPSENWLGDHSKQQNIAPGGRRTFSVKPGTYNVIGGYCQGGQAIGAVGTYGAETTSIEGPTLIALGPKPVDAVAGANTLAFTKLYSVPAGGGGGGDVAESPAEEPASSESSSSPEPSSSSSSSSSEAAPSGPKCLAHGAVCNDAEPCCAGMTCASRTKYSDGSRGNGYCE